MTMRALLTAAALLAAAGPASAAEAVIRGQATPAGRYDLKPGTTLEVELLDISRADVPAETRGTVSVPVKRLGAIPFVLEYDPTAIDAKNAYSVSARLVQDGQAIQRSDTATPVLTRGAGNVARIALVALAQPEPVAAGNDAAALAGDWTLAGLGEEEAVAAGVQSTLTLTAEGEARGRGGCNNFHGTYSVEGGTFRFGPIAATRRACPPPQMEQEIRFFAALDATRGARIEDGALLLLGETGGTVARLAH